MKKFWSMFALLTLPAVMQAEDIMAKEFEYRFTANKPDAVYKAGDTIRFTGNVYFNGKIPVGTKAVCRIYVDGLPQPVKTSNIIISEKPITGETKLDKPGWVRMQINILDKDGKPLIVSFKKRKIPAWGGIGALAEPEKITAGGKEPADFDAFWTAKRKELDKVPMNPQRKKINLGKINTVICYDVKLDCAGGPPVCGYLCMPKDAGPKSCPAIVTYHGAGVGSAVKPIDHAASGLIALDVNAHGLPNGMDRSFYDALSKGAYADYRTRGADDRNKIYFIGMFQRVMRALDYVKSLPEWDGKTLIVMGNSQGGGQSLAAAALDPQVTHCIARVPALCDHAGVLGGRASGWPRFVKTDRATGKMLAGQEKILQETAYVDCAFMAKRIKAECYLSTGLIDTTCVPTSVFAAYNNIPGKKAMSISPTSGHVVPPNTKGTAWLKNFCRALRQPSEASRNGGEHQLVLP